MVLIVLLIILHTDGKTIVQILFSILSIVHLATPIESLL